MDDNLKYIKELNTNMLIYSWLSQALDYPDERLVDNLLKGGIISNLKDTNDQNINLLLSNEMNDIDTYINNFPNKEELLLDLQKDYTRLCFVSKPRLVPLFESVYKEGKLYQDSTFEVSRIYYEAGLKLGEQFKLPPDHITLELELMAYLIFQEIEAKKQGNKANEAMALRLQKDTIKNHLGHFGISLADKLEKNTRTQFYRYIARILRQFLDFELKRYLN